MRTVFISGPGPEAMSVIDRPVPQPGPNEVQVQLHVATLNYRDLLLRRGRGPSTPRFPFVPLSDASGVVTAVGPGASRVRVGDRVAPTFFQDWVSGSPESANFGRALGGPVDGVAREYACFPEGDLVKVPDALGDLEAATLPCAGLTAWNALFCARSTKPGDVVLLQGTGGVSIAGLQLAKMAGATVIITSSSDAKLDRARSMGADHLINYRATANWGEAARELTGGRGVDVVLEVGGAGTMPQTLAALRPGGDIAAIGLLTGAPAQPPSESTPARMHRIRVGNRDQFEDLVRALAANGVRPVVDRVFPLSQLGEALRALEAGELFGKIAIDLR